MRSNGKVRMNRLFGRGRCLDVAIDLVDALDAIADQLERTQPSFADAGGGFRQAECRETHAHSSEC